MSFDLLAFLAATPEAAKIPLAMFVVFGCAKVLAEVFEHFGQPGIVGEILAGILIGPSALNLVQPNDFLTALADLGVMFLLFRVGLEVKASELIRVGASASMVAVLGVVAPFAMGWGIMVLWGESQIESVFVGAAMVATSVGITAQVLAAKGLLDQRSSKMILAAAVIDDVLGLIVLAIVSSSARGQVQIPELLLTAVLAIGFTVIVAKWGTTTMVRIVPRVQAKLRAGEVQFNLAMLLLFGLSLLAIYAGVAAIIGAFLAGMALAESVGHRVHDLAHGVTELLVPFFLAGIGLHLDLSAFAQPETMILALVILAAAVFSKLVGCGLGAYNLGRKEMLRVGAGMVPRGEVGMVVAQIGLGLGVIGQSIYGIVVFMAVATTLIAPALLNYAYKDLIEARKAAGLPPPPPEFRIG
jgi:Kef-type K+ transport system membrane component KefB